MHSQKKVEIEHDLLEDTELISKTDCTYCTHGKAKWLNHPLSRNEVIFVRIYG